MAGPTDHGKGLRGGFVTTQFDDAGASFNVALDHFVEDLGITGQGRYDFAAGGVDANVALVIPGSFGQVQVMGVCLVPARTSSESTARSAAGASP